MTVTIDDQKTHFSFLFFVLSKVNPDHFIIDYRRRRVPHMKESLLLTKREGWLLSYSNNCLHCYFYLIILCFGFLVYRKIMSALKSLNLFSSFIWPFHFFHGDILNLSNSISFVQLLQSLSNSFAILLNIIL